MQNLASLYFKDCWGKGVNTSGKHPQMPLVKRSNSKYWYVQFQVDHQTIVKSTKTSDRIVAQKVEAKLRADAHAGRLLGKKQTLSFQQALDRLISTKQGIANYRNLISHRKAVLKLISGNTHLRLINSDQLAAMKQSAIEQGLAPQTIKHRINLVMSSIRLAQRDGFQTGDVYPPIVKIPGGKNRFLSKEEEQRLLLELDPGREANGLGRQTAERLRNQQDNYDLVVLLLDTGARYSEIANIGWSQINLIEQSIQLWRPKVRNESLLFMSDRVKEILQRRKQTDSGQYVFSSKRGGPRGYRVIAIRKAFKRAGLTDCSIHTLRHTHASRLVQMGMSIYEVQKILGHSDIRTTMRYAHLEEAKVTVKARDLINALNENSRAISLTL